MTHLFGPARDSQIRRPYSDHLANVDFWLPYLLTSVLGPLSVLASLFPYFLTLLSGILIHGSSGRGTTRAEDAQGTPSQSRISPSILVYEDNSGFSNQLVGVTSCM